MLTLDKPITLAHITDVHMFEQYNAFEKFVDLLHNITKLNPDLIINGGDAIFDALKRTKHQIDNDWSLWQKALEIVGDIDVIHCIGNHDVWGTPEAKDHELAGKQLVLKKLGLANSYYSTCIGNWKIIVLDSIEKDSTNNWYTAKLDEIQWEWLQHEVESSAAYHILIVSHIPILSAAVFFDGENEKNGNWTIPHQWMHIDARKIVDFLSKKSNVKLCLSGHLHLYERVEYNNITFICNGAVSGNWWQGSYQNTQSGFGLVELFSDGTFVSQYKNF